MNNNRATFRFDKASFGYSSKNMEKELLRNYSGVIREAELTAVIGRNGTGKSTLLKSMVRLLPVLSGKIFLNNMLLNEISAQEFPRLLSFVSTDLPRNPVMTVYELVSLGRFPYTNWLGSIKPHDREKIMNALEVVNLVEHAGKPLFRISDGERQRAIIARSLAQDTPVIVLDEPTAFLDLPNKYELAALLSDLTGQGKTVIFSTHDTGIAMSFPDNLLILNDETIITGAPEDHIINGTLGGIFTSSRFVFNRENGEIQVNRGLRHQLSMTCNDPAVNNWTVKALRRRGFIMCKKGEGAAHIQFMTENEKNIWKIELKGEDYYLYSLYELNAFLTAHFN